MVLILLEFCCLLGKFLATPFGLVLELPSHTRVSQLRCSLFRKICFLDNKKNHPTVVFYYLGQKDSNLRMAGPKPAALPLGDAPMAFGKSIVAKAKIVVNKCLLYSYIGGNIYEIRQVFKSFKIN